MDLSATLRHSLKEAGLIREVLLVLHIWSRNVLPRMNEIKLWLKDWKHLITARLAKWPQINRRVLVVRAKDKYWYGC